MEVVYYEGTPVFVDLTGKEYDHWRWNLRHHTSRMEPESQLRGGSEMNEKVKVGDKVRWRQHIGLSCVQVAEVIELPSGSQHGHLFHPDWPCPYSFSENPLNCWEKI